MDLLITLLATFGLACLTPVLHRFLGDRVAYVAALLPLAIACYFGQELQNYPSQGTRVAEYAWAPGLDLSISLYLDGLSLLFVLMIAGMGFLVALYAGGYLAGHPQLGLFYSYILAFMGAMLGIVLAGNLLTIYVFWELTTLTSYLLIGFEHERVESRLAARKALLTTAFGGLAMLAGLVLLGLIAGTFEVPALLEGAADIRGHSLYAGMLALILLGAFTKSAQFPFHYWLPAAMEAPTPVSAFLHSATMVQAGVYLLARLSPVLGGTAFWQVTLISFGGVTMLLGAYLAFHEHDLKGVLAYLTINVLGTFVMLLGLGTPAAIKAAMTYLIAHAFYKGALFLVIGAVAHETHTRDSRELRGLARNMPASALVAVLASLSMAGVLPSFGFIAKELYLEAVLHAPQAAWLLAGASIIASSWLVAGAWIVGEGPFWGRVSPHAARAHEGNWKLWASPLLLALAGVATGLFPQKLTAPLITPAIEAVLDQPAKLDLKLWHGATPIFFLSLGVLAAGTVMYLLRERILKALPQGHWLVQWGPEAWYEQSLVALNATAKWQTNFLQTGYLRWYVSTILATAVVLAGLMIAHTGFPTDKNWTVGIRFHEATAVGLILAGAFVTIRSRSRPLAVAALGVVGFNIAWLYALFGAPDLAMTQIIVESLTVVLFLMAFSHLPRFTLQSSRSNRFRDGLLAACVGSVLAVLLLLATNRPPQASISEYFAEYSVSLAHGRNVVNVILVDFGALDTMGEITVLTTAAVGVYSMLRMSGRRRRRTNPVGDAAVSR